MYKYIYNIIYILYICTYIGWCGGNGNSFIHDIPANYK